VKRRPEGAERWAPVSGYEGAYEVSDRGQVRSVPRVRIRSNGRPLTVAGRILRLRLNQTGYWTVDLSGGEKRSFLVHRLVLMAFRGPAPEGTIGCHNNGVKTDNRLENLRWDTYAANMEDSLRHGTHRCGNMFKVVCPFGHDLVEPNLAAWASEMGRRACLACIRARATAAQRRRRGQPADLESLRAFYYEAIMTGSWTASGAPLPRWAG
jgi:hypothetical protein